ncbi:MAG: RNA polymerase sigma factor [Prevotellaceae bacterium]|jgi:RNA polymerase sigma-70 factor (ECF subfamily)|nr:RNA polymerase sigma factor [Prevotellaceae bacterium]
MPIEKVIEGCRYRNRKAQMQLYDLFYKMVYNCCHRILLQSTEAEDAMQETFIKAFNKIDTINGAPPEAWLKRIAINTSIDMLKHKHTLAIELSDNLEYLCGGSATEELEDEEEIALKVEQVKKAIAQLPDIHRIILTLHLLEGYDYCEIAEILNIKESSARTQFTRARQKLIELLKMTNICG